MPSGSPARPGTAPAAHEPAGRRLLVVTCVLVAAWSRALLMMDLWTTGRPVVSPGQVLKADVVVTATRVKGEQDRITVERVFKGEIAQGAVLRVVNLTEVPRLETETGYIFPLSRIREAYAVTKLDGQRSELLIYPSSQATIEQTKAILRDDPVRN